MLSVVLSLIAILFCFTKENIFGLSGWSGRILAMQKVSARLCTVWFSDAFSRRAVWIEDEKLCFSLYMKS